MPELREFHLPDLGEGLPTAEIVRWYVGVGSPVTDGTPVCEVETAKATVELPIPFDGVVHEIRFAEGATVEVGAPIVVVSVADETKQGALLVGYGATAPATSRWAARRAARGAPEVTPGRDGPLPAKPPVRRLARDLGVDLARVTPTGPGGTITRADVEAFAPQPPSPSPPPAPANGVRRAMARAMTSAASVPHASESVTVDVTRTMKLVRRLAADPDFAGRRVTPLLLVARALLAAIARYPGINAAWDAGREETVERRQVNLGIAVAAPKGLLVPNIKDAPALTLPQLAGALTELTERARAGRTAPAEMSGGTCTITNIGALGMDSGSPILNPGESAILAFGAVRPRPWVHKGKLRSRQVSTLTLAFDHRLVDGELGARVLAMVAAALERPDRLLVWT
ncbi:dihydrolipoamide acetyltransferase family protein [Dactylosporangium sp. CA-092794]|uniref:dihydrolipoamide acetyltransferase family protein n=1 Tax=Dactylosporangium sp. CA-092794 TaxID=3239929 RepID=UPI003D8F9CAC